MEPLPSQVKMISNFPWPSMVKELQALMVDSFRGFIHSAVGPCCCSQLPLKVA